MQAHEVRGVAGPEKSAAQAVVPHRVDAGGGEHVEERDSVRDGPRAEEVDVSFHQVVGMFVVAAEHARLRGLVEQGPEFSEILGSRALADEDSHPETELFPGFVNAEAFMVGLDAGCHIGFEIGAAQARCVSVDALAVAFGDGEFLHDLRIAVDDAREIHHLRQVEQRPVAAKFLDGRRAEGGPGRFEGGCRHAGGDAEVNFARRLCGEVLHVTHAVDA